MDAYIYKNITVKTKTFKKYFKNNKKENDLHK